MELFSLRGKVALITGGRAMYGLGCSEALCEAGATVYLASHSADAAIDAANALAARYGARVETVEFHQEDPDSIQNMIDEVVRREGRIDVFVNASRVIPKGGVGWLQEEEGLAWSVRVNSAGMLYMTMLVGEQMMRQRGGSIVLFGSMMGLVGVEKSNYDGEPGMAAGAFAHDYALNKSGITAWTRHAAGYLGRYGVRVNTLCPGGLSSERTPPRFRDNYAKHTQLGRLADTRDIKGPLLFFASDASAYVTGVSLPVDGGYTVI